VYRTDFPDLTWLKKQIDRGFENNQLLGWPNVVINAHTRSEHRPEVRGTLSLFSNISAESICAAENYTVTIPEDYFFISNNKQEYSLDIETEKPVETFNIHFSEMLLQDISHNVHHSHIALLDGNTNTTTPLLFYNKLYRKDAIFNALTTQIKTKAATNELGDAELEELLTDLLYHLIQQNTYVGKQVNSLDAEKFSTRKELYRRLARATDYMAAHYTQAIPLDELAGVACLSKFHFIRLFKAVFKQSPYQYITSLRMQRAANLLQHSALEIQQIAGWVGYDNSSSFCRAFLKHTRCSPQEFRKGKVIMALG
jgi:AraC family transcriptional regulator